MKKFVTGAVFALSFTLSHLANAYVIKSGSFSGTDVGALDSLIGQTTGLKNSNPTTETAWVNSLLDPDTEFTVKKENVRYFATLESPTVFAFQLQQTPGYFLIKNAKWWSLFENTGKAEWAVVDFSLLNAGFKLPDLKGLTISHVSEFGEFHEVEVPEVKVPEPNNLWLLGVGLLGLVIMRKHQKRQQ